MLDVDTDPEAERKVIHWNGGYLSTPTLTVDGRVLTEPSDDDLAEILGLDVPFE